LRFGYLHLNSFSNQKWYNELMFDKYKELVNDDQSQSSSKKTDSTQSLSSTSSDEGFEKIMKSESSSKLDGSCEILAINSAKKYFTKYNFKPNKSSYLNLKINNKKSDLLEECLSFEDDVTYQQEFISDLSNWLDKYTEGLCDQNKKYVEAWPVYY
jgi:hypothetical protein